MHMLPAFNLKPFPLRGDPHPWDVEQAMEKVVRHLWAIALKRSALLSYEHVYRTQYNVVMNGHGWFVYNTILEILRQMSLRMCFQDYQCAITVMHSVSLHLDNQWRATRELPGIIDAAMSAFNRPVAQRWRRVVGVVRWGARIRLWRAAFTEVWLRPGGVGENELSKRFDDNKKALSPTDTRV